MRYATVHFLLTMVLTALTLPAHPAVTGGTIKITGELVTVQGEGIRISEALDEICRATGLDIHIFQNIEGKLCTSSFEDKPLGVALSRLLKGVNYAVIYSGKADHADPTAADPSDHTAGGPVPQNRTAPEGECEGDRCGMFVTWAGNGSGNSKAPGANLFDHRDEISGERPVPTASLYSSASTAGAMPREDGYSGGGPPYETPYQTPRSSSEGESTEVEPRGNETGSQAGALEQSGAGSGSPASASGATPGRPFTEGNTDGDISPGGEPNLDTQGEWPSTRSVILNHIKLLEARIASGQSDSEYQYWKQQYGDRFNIIHDKTQLEKYREMLSRME